MFGWMNNILKVDLTNQKKLNESLDIEFAKKWLGGRGFNSKILYDEFDPSIEDPFNPKNIICLSSGLLEATSSPACRHTTVSVGRSPVTGLFSDSGIGGHFGPELKRAGYETIVIYGRSDSPVYIWIEDEKAEIRDATHLWGKDTWETEKAIKKELGDRTVKILTIGPAGENKIAYSGVIHCDNLTGEGGTRIGSKAGAGAVFGSKNLKAIVVKGTKKLDLADEQGFNDYTAMVREKLTSFDPLMKGLGEYGTQSLTEPFYGMLPIKDYQLTNIEGIENLFAENIRKEHPLIRSRPCFGCPLPHCNNFYKLKDGTIVEGPQYQTIVHLGPACGIVDPDQVMDLNRLCNKLGLDTVNTGSMIGLMMHLWQDKILTKDDTDGLELEWGNADVVKAIIKKMVDKEGFGGVLADGAFTAIKKIAQNKGISIKNLENYIVHIKKTFVPAAELRPAKGIALSYGTATRGADHLRGITKLEAMPFIKTVEDLVSHGYPLEVAEKAIAFKCNEISRYDGKGYAVKFIEDGYAAFSASGICLFITFYNLCPFGVEDLARMVTLATGESYSWRDILACGERISNIEKIMQIRMGAQRKDDLMPERYFEEKIPDGPFKGEVIDRDEYDKMLDEYYQFRGWTSKGIPKKAKLEELKLEYAWKDLS